MIQRALVEERHVRAKLEDQSKHFKSQVEVLRDIVLSAIENSKQFNIETIGAVGVLGDARDNSRITADQPTSKRHQNTD